MEGKEAAVPAAFMHNSTHQTANAACKNNACKLASFQPRVPHTFCCLPCEAGTAACELLEARARFTQRGATSEEEEAADP